jgi:hypothetical protein
MAGLQRVSQVACSTFFALDNASAVKHTTAPAMEAGIADHVWNLNEIADLVP